MLRNISFFFFLNTFYSVSSIKQSWMHFPGQGYSEEGEKTEQNKSDVRWSSSAPRLPQTQLEQEEEVGVRKVRRWRLNRLQEENSSSTSLLLTEIIKVRGFTGFHSLYSSPKCGRRAAVGNADKIRFVSVTLYSSYWTGSVHIILPFGAAESRPLGLMDHSFPCVSWEVILFHIIGNVAIWHCGQTWMMDQGVSGPCRIMNATGPHTDTQYQLKIFFFF